MEKVQARFFLLALIFLTFSLYPLRAQQPKNPEEKLDSLIKRGNELVLNDPKKAVEYGLKAAEQAEAKNDYKRLQEAYTLLRNSYFYYGLMEEAAYYSTKNFQLAEEKGTEQDLFFARVNQGGIWFILGKIDKAKVFFLDALNYMERQPAQPQDSLYAQVMSSVLNNLSLVEINSKNYEKAKDYADRGFQIARQNPKIPLEYVRILNNYADILQHLNRKEEAEELLNEALNISVSSNSPIMEATTLYSLARFYFRNQQLEQANLVANRALTMAKNNENLSLESGISTLLYEEYQKLNMPDSVLKYRMIQEKIDSLSKYGAANELMLKEELQNEFKKTLAQAQEKERNQKFLFYAVSGFSLIVISLLIYFFYRAKQNAQESTREKLKSEELATQIAGKVEILENEIKEKTTELSVQSLKKLEKDKRIEDLLKKLLSSENSSTADKVYLKEELKDTKQTVKEFDLIFGEVHSGFLSKLQRDFPTLTLSERRMCAMLKLQLTTKEISQITRQSIRSIEITRTRLRKKLNLTNQSIRISDFLSSY